MNAKRPLPKDFDSSEFNGELRNLTKEMGNRKIENQTEFLVPYILEKYEEFEKVERCPYRGGPFDYIGFKNNIPYIIEYKGSLDNFHTPKKTQKRRLQEVLEQFDNLEIVLLQVNINTSQYRIFYTEQMMEFLFKGKEMPLKPIIDWLKDRI